MKQVHSLDPAQKAAAWSNGSVQLVLAGPGSGKTTTLTSRFVHLVQQGVDRTRILALTFTKKAADEMKARIGAALELQSARDLNVSTFHAFAFRHLRENPQPAGLPTNFQLWDALEQRSVFHSRRMWWNEDSDILEIIAGAKERLLDAASFAAQVKDKDEVHGAAVDFFRVYEQALRNAGAIDFADMVPLLVGAMRKSSAYAGTITGAFDHVLVDEYQDVNPGQVKLLDLFRDAGVQLWAVGDDDQMLYAFRAADIRFILDFPRKYRGAQVHVLDRNYRSAASIVAVAKRLIAHNRARREKAYRPVVTEAGEIVIRGYRTPEIEARQAARAVAALLERGHPLQEIAVLYRTGTVGLAVQPALKKLGIRYEVRGAGDLWQSTAAKLVVGSLHYLRNGDSAEAMSRMGTGKRAEIVREQLDQAGSEIKRDFSASCRLVGDVVSTAVPSRASDRDRTEWTSVVEAVIDLALSCRSLEQLESEITEQSAAIRRPAENAVVLSTIHSAKGLEWETVLMVGMEEGVLPHANNSDVEEERRIAYVGITRAKRRLGLTYATSRFGQGSRPSKFLSELASTEKPHCIWTVPAGDGADERLPLLSNRERGFLNQPSPRQKGRKRAGKRRTESVTAGDLPARQGHSWSAGEDRQLRTRFLAGETLARMAQSHQRTKGAIRSRLIKLELIAPDLVAGFDAHDAGPKT